MKELSIPLDVVQRWMNRQVFFVLALAVCTTALVAVWTRHADAMTSPDHALSFALGVVLPLAALSFVRHMAGADSLRNFAAPEVRLGASRRGSVLTSLWPLLAGLVALAVLLTMIALVLTHGARGPRLGADVLASVPVACATALAYGTCLTAGASFGARGAGSLWFLLFDVVFGSMPLPVALFTPRGHLRHLLGLESVAELPQWASFPPLVGLSLLALALLFIRVPR